MPRGRRGRGRRAYANASPRKKNKKDQPRECLPGLNKFSTKTKPNYYFAGIDPGKAGGFSILFPDGKAVAFPTPMKNKAGIRKYDTKRMFQLLCMLHALRKKGGVVRVFIELQQGRPITGKGITQTIGEGFGRWMALIEVLDLTVEAFSPSMWKPIYVPTNAHKVASVMASKIMYKTEFRDTEDGLAEAVLIADYGKRRMFGWLSNSERES